MSSDSQTIYVAIIAASGTLLGALSAQLVSVLNTFLQRKTEKIKLTYADRGKALCSIIVLCDSMLHNYDPTDSPDYKYYYSMLPNLAKIKESYYLLPKDIIDTVESVYDRISVINYFGHPDIDVSDTKHFFEKNFYDTIIALSKRVVKEINKG